MTTFAKGKQTAKPKPAEILAEWKQSKPPVDVAFLAEKADVNLVYDELDNDVSGFLLQPRDLHVEHGIGGAHAELVAFVPLAVRALKWIQKTGW